MLKQELFLLNILHLGKIKMGLEISIRPGTNCMVYLVNFGYIMLLNLQLIL